MKSSGRQYFKETQQQVPRSQDGHVFGCPKSKHLEVTEREERGMWQRLAT